MGFAATLYLKLFPAPSVSETVIVVLPEAEPAADVAVKTLLATVFFLHARSRYVLLRYRRQIHRRDVQFVPV